MSRCTSSQTNHLFLAIRAAIRPDIPRSRNGHQTGDLGAIADWLSRTLKYAVFL